MSIRQSKFIDVDLDIEARKRMIPQGYQAGERVPSGVFAKFGDSIDIIPRSQWKELSEGIAEDGGGCQALVTRIYNQQSEGSCVSNATGQAHEICQARQFGKDKVVHLSAISLYKRCGRSPGSGSTVGGNWEEIKETGILPLENADNARFAHRMPNTGFYERYPDGWESTARLFRGVEAYIVESVDELITALLNQWPVIVGRRGHSICYCDYVLDDGAGFVKYANSWGNWGENGYGYDSMRLVSESADWAVAVRTVTAEPLLA